MKKQRATGLVYPDRVIKSRDLARHDSFGCRPFDISKGSCETGMML